MRALEPPVGGERQGQERDAEHRPRNIVALWLGFLGAPAVWLLSLSANYALVEVACTKRTMLPLHVSNVLTLLLVLGAGWLALTQWNRLGRGWGSEAGDAPTRSRFLAVMGVILSALFAVVVLAQWLGTAFLHPCMGI